MSSTRLYYGWILFFSFGTLTCTDLKTVKFSDDIIVCITEKSLCHLIQYVKSQVSKTSEWWRANRLSHNVAKSSHSLYPYKKDHTSTAITILGQAFPRSNKNKLLGIMIDNKLYFRNQKDHFSKKKNRSSNGVINKT